MSEVKAEVEQREPPTFIPRKNALRRRLHIGYTEQEYDVIQEVAAMCGKPIGVFIRDESLSVQVKAKPFLRDAELRRKLGQCSIALTRLAATARETGALSVPDELDSAVQELLVVIRQIASAAPAKTR
jgi:hypothetical protein